MEGRFIRLKRFVTIQVEAIADYKETMLTKSGDLNTTRSMIMGLIVFDIEEKPIDDRPSFIGLTYDGGLINIQASNNCIEWRLMNRGDLLIFKGNMMGSVQSFPTEIKADYFIDKVTHFSEINRCIDLPKNFPENNCAAVIHVQTIYRPLHDINIRSLSPWVITGTMMKERISVRVSSMIETQVKRLATLQIGQVLFISPVKFSKKVHFDEVMTYATAIPSSIISINPKFN